MTEDTPGASSRAELRTSLALIMTADNLIKPNDVNVHSWHRLHSIARTNGTLTIRLPRLAPYARLLERSCRRYTASHLFGPSSSNATREDTISYTTVQVVLVEAAVAAFGNRHLTSSRGLLTSNVSASDRTTTFHALTSIHFVRKS